MLFAQNINCYVYSPSLPSRMKQVQEEQFVNFAVKMFLETQESELRRCEDLEQLLKTGF